MALSVRILVVDAEPSILEFLAMALTSEGYCVATAEDVAHSIALLEEFIPDVVIFDTYPPSTLALIQRCQQAPDKIIHLIGLTTSIKVEEQAQKLGIEIIFTKPFDLDALLVAIQECLTA